VNADNNVVAGNRIGTNSTATAALGNVQIGIWIVDTTCDNTRIGTNADGTSDALEQNIVAGNLAGGIADAGNKTVIAGNYVGVAADGVSKLGNAGGIALEGTNARVGTNADGINDAAERNVIGGNTFYGVDLLGAGVTGNVVAGNYIGVSKNGDVKIANGTDGVLIDKGAHDNIIGGLTAK